MRPQRPSCHLFLHLKNNAKLWDTSPTSFSLIFSVLIIELIRKLDIMHACVRAKLLQSCLTLCDPMDYSMPGTSVHGLLQARILGWTAIALFQVIFSTEGSNSHLLWLLHCRQILCCWGTREAPTRTLYFLFIQPHQSMLKIPSTHRMVIEIIGKKRFLFILLSLINPSTKHLEPTT